MGQGFAVVGGFDPGAGGQKVDERSDPSGGAGEVASLEQEGDPAGAGLGGGVADEGGEGGCQDSTCEGEQPESGARGSPAQPGDESGQGEGGDAADHEFPGDGEGGEGPDHVQGYPGEDRSAVDFGDLHEEIDEAGSGGDPGSECGGARDAAVQGDEPLGSVDVGSSLGWCCGGAEEEEGEDGPGEEDEETAELEGVEGRVFHGAAGRGRRAIGRGF